MGARGCGGGGGGSGSAPIYLIDVHPNGTRFATAGGDGTVKVWDVVCGVPVW